MVKNAYFFNDVSFAYLSLFWLIIADYMLNNRCIEFYK